MITKVYALLSLVAGLALAILLSYYLNIRFDHKTVFAYLKLKFRSAIAG
ncbi:MAG TPA: hypothetical protein VFG46_19665 [Chryseolinea sp.]|nr:hypothetical protein [Chryseolinea sp.]